MQNITKVKGEKMIYPKNKFDLDNEEYDDDPIKELQPSKKAKNITTISVIVIVIIILQLITIKMLSEYMDNLEKSMNVSNMDEIETVDMGSSKKDVLYSNNAVWKTDGYINIDTIKSVDELVEGQKYYLEEEKLIDEIDWVNWPHYIIHKLKDGTEIWFIIEEEEQQQFNKNNVKEKGTLSIEKRFKDPNSEGYTVYIVR